MSLSLYRQYRPQTFARVVGQDHVTQTLKQEIIQGKVAHAYLFAGPRGIGKTTSARLIAKAVNCLNRDAASAEPCNTCAACLEITGGKSLDVIEIDAASHTGVDNVRENIIENSRFAPSKWQSKVFIIDEVHMLSTSAFNALLKILEEPPAHVIFILATTELHKIPATIISRCQRFDFRRVSTAAVIGHLTDICQQEQVHCDEEVLAAIARQSEGYLRDAVGLLGQVLSLGEKKVTLATAELVLPRLNTAAIAELAATLVVGDQVGSLAIVGRLTDDGVNIPRFTQELVEYLRLMLLTASGSAPVETLTAEEQVRMAKLAGQTTPRQLTKIMETLLQYGQQFRHSHVPQLALELAIMVLTTPNDQPPPPEAPKPILKKAPSVTTTTTPSASPTVKSDPLPVASAAVTSEQPPAASVASTVSVPPVASEPVVSLDQVRSVWAQLIDALDETRHSLAMTLRLGVVREINGASVTVGFPYQLHRDQVADPKNKLTIAETLSRVLGVSVMVEPVVAAELATETTVTAKTPAPLHDVAAMFGGQVVS